MKVVSREQLKDKLDRGEDVKLVMTMNQWAYDSMHIPGSLHFKNLTEVDGLLGNYINAS